MLTSGKTGGIISNCWADWLKNFKKDIDNHETLWYNQKITEMSKERKISSKKLKNFLTDTKVCDKISKLSQRQQQRTLITEQWHILESSKEFSS